MIPGREAGAWPVALRSLQLICAAGLGAFVFLGSWLAAGGGLRSRSERAAGRALLAICTRLGATFIKVGQIASTRTDLLPAPIAQELAKLQDRVPAFSFEAARAVIEDDLGAPLATLFPEFDPVPVAAASVAQVHRAKLPTGEGVAVKVRRPDIRDLVALDRAILRALARTLERVVPTLRLVSAEQAVAQFCDAVEEQLDMRIEAQNNGRFTANFADDPEILFPALHPSHCGGAVLTMEFVEGIEEAGLRAAGLDVHRIVTAGMRGVCRMIFLHGFVHADLHPGNLRFLPPGRVVLLDLGLVGSLSDEDRLTTAQLLFALATGDGRTVARLFHDTAPHAATPDYAAFEREVVALVEGVHRKGLDQIQITVEIGRIFDILRRHRVQARSHMTIVNLALMTAEGLAKRLAPDLELTEEALPYLAEALGVPAPARQTD